MIREKKLDNFLFYSIKVVESFLGIYIITLVILYYAGNNKNITCYLFIYIHCKVNG